MFKYLSLLILAWYLCTSVKDRHDILKVASFNMDDHVVRWGLISDKDLHAYGAMLGLCKEKR